MKRDRILDILSADRAGYEYSIPLSRGISTDQEGVGGFSIDYTPDGVWGTEDASYMNASLHCSGNGYSITTAFYQNDALFYSDALLQKFRTFASSGLDEGENVAPSLKYDVIDQSVKISVNGYPAQKISVSHSRGNGHHDYRFSFEGIPLFRKEEVQEIHFSVDRNDDAEKYKIEFMVDQQEGRL